MKAALLVASVVSLVAGACAGPGRESTVVFRPSSGTPEPSTTCPFGIRGARITMSDTAEGVVFAVRAYGGDLAEVRRRAHDAAAHITSSFHAAYWQ